MISRAVPITLTEAEYEDARLCGVERSQNSKRWGFKNLLSVSRPDKDIIGAACECACAKFYGVKWNRTTHLTKIGDIGHGIEVRGTDYPDGHLIIRPRDPSRFHVLVIQNKMHRMEFWIVGFITKLEAMLHDEWRANPKKMGWCWMVPQHALADPHELFKLIRSLPEPPREWSPVGTAAREPGTPPASPTSPGVPSSARGS